MCENSTKGDRIRALFTEESGNYVVVAPFIKVDALRSLLEVLPTNVHLRCVTRWLPQEIAAGVSDPEILDLLEDRGNFSLTLADRLHAKLYVAGTRCLVGSANVTSSGLGESEGGGNIEVLVETTVDDPAVIATLEEIEKSERIATKSMAQVARYLASCLSNRTSPAEVMDSYWMPCSRHPERAYRLYGQPPPDYTTQADKIVLADLAHANLSPGLNEEEFKEDIRSLLADIPLAATILNATNDEVLTRADANSWLNIVANKDFSSQDLWLALVQWVAYFFPDRVMKQEITELSLRRAQIIS